MRFAPLTTVIPLIFAIKSSFDVALTISPYSPGGGAVATLSYREVGDYSKSYDVPSMCFLMSRK